MKIDDCFQFRHDLESAGSSGSFCVTLPAEITTGKGLIEVLKDVLLFPAYCGSNWDAIDECMRDFTWIEQYQICILHPVIPNVPAKDLKIYLEILCSGIETFRHDGEHELVVIFNNKDRVHVESAVS